MHKLNKVNKFDSSEQNVHTIKAPFIVEIANGPVTPEADKILLDKKIQVIPDILVNSGGVSLVILSGHKI